jgi:hypothetical protein
MTALGTEVVTTLIAALEAFTAACHDRHQRTGQGHQHYLAAVSNTQRVVFHLGIVDQLPRSSGPVPFAERLAEVRPAPSARR